MSNFSKDPSATLPLRIRPSLLGRLRRVLPFQKKKAGRITVILNPAAGQSSPLLKTFNRVFHEAGYAWDIRLTNQFGDGQHHARRAIQEGVDIVAVYGGDGSIMDVAAGMIGSQVPLAILPGGTGNAGPVYAVHPRVVLAWGEFPVDATRWVFNTDQSKK